MKLTDSYVRAREMDISVHPCLVWDQVGMRRKNEQSPGRILLKLRIYMFFSSVKELVIHESPLFAMSVHIGRLPGLYKVAWSSQFTWWKHERHQGRWQDVTSIEKVWLDVRSYLNGSCLFGGQVDSCHAIKPRPSLRQNPRQAINKVLVHMLGMEK